MEQRRNRRLVDGWNFADVWETIASVAPEEPALVHGSTRRTWAEFDRRAGGVASTILTHRLGRQAKVAQYLYNCSEYMESVFAAFKAGLVPVNTNYRYVDGELVYLWDNADVGAVVFHGAFEERIERIRGSLSGVQLWLWVQDSDRSCPSWAVPYEEAAAAVETVRSVRSGDDLLLLYTGGTTGSPKGVMWRQDDLYNSFSQNAWRDPTNPDLAAVAARVEARRRPVGLPACPLMHGTGLFGAMGQLSQAGTVVTVPSTRFDVNELLDTVERERVNVLYIVGDAFAKPIASAIEAEPERWELSSLIAIISSGVMLSEATKTSLLGRSQRLRIIDALSSSEAMGAATSVSSSGGTAETATFTLGEHTRVIADDGSDVVPGSGAVGLLAVAGHQPLGYYKDPAKSAATFRDIGGQRYSVPGDYATVAADGTLTLLGRGSGCINTGGEKVFPEEVEEALKQHTEVRDAAVIGLPDDRFGEVVVALVELEDGTSIEPRSLIDHVRETLAAYKAPRTVLIVESIDRAPNGKIPYARHRERALELPSVTDC